MSGAPRTERLGVHRLGQYFGEAGWLYREQPTEDYGIDAQVEIVDRNGPTGALIGIQIKSGSSYFDEETEGAYVFRSNDTHIRYWLGHALPVILVLYDPRKNTLYWEVVSEDTIQSTGRGWRIDVPKENILSDQSLSRLHSLTQPAPYIQKLNRLRLDWTWLDLVAAGEVVYVEFEDWVNKSLPRFAVTIGCDTRNDIQEQEWPTRYGPGMTFEDLLQYLLPWADFQMDEDAYESYMEEKWMADCYMGRDEDTGEPYYTRPFEDYYSPPEGVVPVSDNGETEGYRLIVSLNELGRGFIMIDDYLREEEDLERRSFTLGT